MENIKLRKWVALFLAGFSTAKVASGNLDGNPEDLYEPTIAFFMGLEDQNITEEAVRREIDLIVQEMH